MLTRVLLAFGTRAEAIKMAPVVEYLKSNAPSYETIVCATGQHRELLDQVFFAFGFQPDVDLKVMRHGQDLFDITSSVVLGMREVLKAKRPQFVLVQGDTTTAFAAALAASYLRIPVGHIEAGLRTGDKFAPFPEEINRQLIARIADVHFAPTTLCEHNLRSEGIPAGRVVVTGNTGIDALFLMLRRIRQNPSMRTLVESKLSALLRFNWHAEKFALVTVHRRENFGVPLRRICNAISLVARRYPNVHFVYPVHPNPNVRGPVESTLSGHANVHLIEPLAYTEFSWLLNACYFVLTDSGGLQEEAPALGKPLLVLRDTTERAEVIAAGSGRLLGTHSDRIVAAVVRLLEDADEYSQLARIDRSFGDGQASMRIVGALSVLVASPDQPAGPFRGVLAT